MSFLLENLRSLTAPDQMGPEQRAAAAELEPCYERMKAAFGLDFANDVWGKQARVNEFELAEAFARGVPAGGPAGAGALPGGRAGLGPAPTDIPASFPGGNGARAVGDAGPYARF